MTVSTANDVRQNLIELFKEARKNAGPKPTDLKPNERSPWLDEIVDTVWTQIEGNEQLIQDTWKLAMRNFFLVQVQAPEKSDPTRELAKLSSYAESFKSGANSASKRSKKLADGPIMDPEAIFNMQITIGGREFVPNQMTPDDYDWAGDYFKVRSNETLAKSNSCFAISKKMRAAKAEAFSELPLEVRQNLYSL